MPAKPQASQQIGTLAKLTQAAAAHLLGVSGRTLRDAYDAPRNPDGTYSGPELVAWWLGRGQRPDGLTDDELEIVAKAGDVHYAAVPESLALPLADHLNTLHAKHGAALLHELGGIMLSNLSTVGRHYADQADPNALHITTVCEACGKVRRGRRWIESKPSAGIETIGGGCPLCFPEIRRS